MTLEIVAREQEGITILDLKGPLRFGQEDLEFRSQLLKLCQAGTLRVIVNLRDVTHLDTTGLGTLLFALAKLQKAGGRLAIFNLNKSHIDLVLLARMDAVFEVFKDEQDAINSFFPDRKVPRFDILEFVRSAEHDHPPNQ
ncbi:MAG: STAS domain-containing protein [Bryobacteraceae bacterium]|jgi:anti-sigma B factor antagonist